MNIYASIHIHTFHKKTQMTQGRMTLLLSPALKQLLYDMDSTQYLPIFFCFFTSLLVILKLTRRNKLNLPPSPPKLPIIGNLHQLGKLPHRSFHTLSLKYGPLMMLKLGKIPAIVVSSVDVAKEIFKNHDVVFSNKPQNASAKIILYGCTNIAFAPYGEEWRQRRKICVVELLNLKRVQFFHSKRGEEVAELVSTLREACASKKPFVNMSDMLISTSNNIVSRCVLGQKYDNRDGGGSFGELTRTMMEQLATLSVGDFFPSLGWVDFLTGQVQKFKATFSELDAFFDQVIVDHKKMKKEDDQSDKKDFVEILLQIQHEFKLTDNNIKAILLDMFAGGTDTTSTLLEWTFAELMKNPNIMKKVQEEIRRVVGYKLKVDENDVNQMNYLKCVIKEVLRVHPPAPLLIPRETSTDVKVRGFDIPAKTRVFVNAWAIQRDTEFWKNPNEFIPERFEEHQETDFKGQDLQFIPFGTGRRGCPGITFGLASTEYVLANLLYLFDWKLPKIGEAMQDMDMTEIHGLTVCKKVPLYLEPELHSFGSNF